VLRFAPLPHYAIYAYLLNVYFSDRTLLHKEYLSRRRLRYSLLLQALKYRILPKNVYIFSDFTASENPFMSY